MFGGKLLQLPGDHSSKKKKIKKWKIPCRPSNKGVISKQEKKTVGSIITIL